jgi:hypothetical protein
MNATQGNAGRAVGWARIDDAASGLIYGAIMVLSILMAAVNHSEAPFETSIVLFGSVLAITLAKAFAEAVGGTLDSGQRVTRTTWLHAWQHSYPTLAVANLPTVFYIAAGFGYLAPGTALLLSQALCVALLTGVGARVGWVVDGRPTPAMLGAILAGSVGFLLALLKHMIH